MSRAADAPSLQCIEQEPRADVARASVIWLHGLGATAHDFESVPPELGLPDDLAVRFIFPQAPSIPVTVNYGMVMPAWYDIVSLGGGAGRNQDAEGIRRSEGQVRALIEREVSRGIPASKIVVGGFSQGGAIALQTGLRHGERLAGIMVLSAYLLLADETRDERSEANTGVPIFMAHGTHDPMVQLPLAVRSHEALTDMGYEVEWNTYPMAHQVCLEEIEAIGDWLRRILG
ncbi:MAG: alpha/beta hydrolase [Thermoanaerobaculia bacterium]|nr:alpha/beta hydrolase [Thermoanaerobaculia bacterium]